MGHLDNLKVLTKSIIPLVIIAFLFVGVVALGGVSLNQTAHNYGQMVENTDPAAVNLARFRQSISQLGYDLYRSTTLTCMGADAKACDDLDIDFKADMVLGERALAQASQLDPAHAGDHQQMLATFKAIEAVATPAMALSQQDKNAEAAKAMAVADPMVRTLSASVKAYNDDRLSESKAQSNALAASAARATWTMVLVGALAILGGLAFAIWLSATKIAAPLTNLADRMKVLAGGDLDVVVDGQGRSDEVGLMAKAVQTFKDNGLRTRALETEAERMRQQADQERQRAEAERQRTQAEQAAVVQALAVSLGRLAEGDLTTQIDAQFEGEYLKIKTDFNSAIDRLREAMSAIATATHSITGGSDEIASASDDLSRRTEQQAASLEETAGALEQITATVRRSADGAKQAAGAASAAKIDASRSGSVMAEAVSAMGEIEQSSNQITQIISVIDEIAFQTNLLALNAGVEAARAGDAGRGFAVVAQEVRALAQRSAGAALEIKNLIASSSAQVERGVRLVGDTGKALDAIVAKVGSIDLLIGEIAQASQEQAVGLNQVNVAVNQMDQVTQQNAAMVEEATAATANLKGEAAELSRLIARFKTAAEGAWSPGSSASDRMRPKLAAHRR